MRFDIFPAGGGRLPVPSTADRAATEAVLKNRWSQADAKGAQLDAKLLAVDGLRREAAEALDRPQCVTSPWSKLYASRPPRAILPGAYEAAEDFVFDFRRRS